MSDTSQLISGTCPRCGSTEVYTNSNLAHRGERTSISVSGWRRLYLYVNICIKCGFFEEYIPQSELDDKDAIEVITSTWEKINKS